MVKQAMKFLGTLVLTALVLLAVSAFAFTIYTLPSDVSGALRKGDRVVANRFRHTDFQKGDFIVYRDSDGTAAGIVTAVPGDTVRLDGLQYVIPYKCGKTYGCPGCKLYLVAAAGNRYIVHQHTIIGQATRLYHLPW